MMNWLWAIPWVVLIIFSAGWILGKRFGKKHVNKSRMLEDDIGLLFRNYTDMAREIERLKEEQANG